MEEMLNLNIALEAIRLQMFRENSYDGVLTVYNELTDLREQFRKQVLKKNNVDKFLHDNVFYDNVYDFMKKLNDEIFIITEVMKQANDFEQSAIDNDFPIKNIFKYFSFRQLYKREKDYIMNKEVN